MSTTFATLATPTSGIGASTALNTIGPATFMLAGPAPASSIYVLEISVDGVGFEPLVRLLPGAPLTLEKVPFVACRMRVLNGAAGVSAVVGYTDIIAGRQAASAVTLPVNGAAQSMPANQTAGKVLVASGVFDGTVTLEGASSNGIFVPIAQFSFTRLSAFDTSAFLFTAVVQQMRVRLTGTGSPTITIGASTDTGSGSGSEEQLVFLGGRPGPQTGGIFIWLNPDGEQSGSPGAMGIPLKVGDVLSEFELKLGDVDAAITDGAVVVGNQQDSGTTLLSMSFSVIGSLFRMVDLVGTLTIPALTGGDAEFQSPNGFQPIFFWVEGTMAGTNSVSAQLSFKLTRSS